jgi:hypothetical protein
MSELWRTNWFEGKEMSAVRSLDGGARDFFLCVLGYVIASCYRAGQLCFSHGIYDAEQNALKVVAKDGGPIWNRKWTRL